MNFKALTFAITAIAFSSIPLLAVAEGGYLGGQYTKTSIDTSLNGLGSLEWEPNNIMLRGGIALNKHFSLESRFGFSAGDDSINDVTLEVDKLLGIYLKLSAGGTFSPYVIAGLTSISLDSNVTPPGSDESVSYGLGVDFKISEQAALNFEYMNYFEDDYGGVEVDITAIAIGFSYLF